MSDATLHTDCTCCEHAAKEISRRKEELKEAREIVSATADYLSDEWFPHISKKGNSRSRIKERARAFLDRGE